MLYVEGHVDHAIFVAACEKYASFAVIDPAKIRHAWIRWRKATKEEAEPGVSETAAEIEDRPAKRSFPVTICDDWLPLWANQRSHERHRTSLAAAQTTS